MVLRKIPPQKFCEVINNVNYLNVLKYGLANTVVIRHKRFDEVGGFDQQMKCGFEDWEFCFLLKVFCTKMNCGHFSWLVWRKTFVCSLL